MISFCYNFRPFRIDRTCTTVLSLAYGASSHKSKKMQWSKQESSWLRRPLTAWEVRKLLQTQLLRILWEIALIWMSQRFFKSWKLPRIISERWRARQMTRRLSQNPHRKRYWNKKNGYRASCLKNSKVWYLIQCKIAQVKISAFHLCLQTWTPTAVHH